MTTHQPKPKLTSKELLRNELKEFASRQQPKLGTSNNQYQKATSVVDYQDLERGTLGINREALMFTPAKESVRSFNIEEFYKFGMA